MHGSIWLEEALNIQFVLLKHGVNFLVVLRIEDLLKITTHTVLLIVEAINVSSTNCEDVLSQELSHHASKWNE